MLKEWEVKSASGELWNIWFYTLASYITRALAEQNPDK